MKHVLKTLGALALLAAVLIAGPLTTSVFVSSGVSDDGTLRSEIGREALRNASSMCLDHPIAAATTPRLALRRLELVDASGGVLDQPVDRSARIEMLPSQSHEGQAASLIAAPVPHFRYRAEIAKYGWFAIPTGTIRLGADGSAICR